MGISSLVTIRSTKPCSSWNSAVWNSSGSFCFIVPSITRLPAKPISALGSEIIISPSIAKLAVTPPVVGSVSTVIYKSPAFECLAAAADTFAEMLNTDPNRSQDEPGIWVTEAANKVGEYKVRNSATGGAYYVSSIVGNTSAGSGDSVITAPTWKHEENGTVTGPDHGYIVNIRKEKDERVKNLIRLAHLEGNEEKYPVMLSGGMQQRVAVARALAGQPKALMMDEPLGAIDFQMRELMQNDLDQMIRETGITTVMVTHDVAESVFFSDRVIVMSGFEGQILEDLHIDLPKPRNRESPEFNRLQTHLSSLLRRAFADRDKYRVLSEQK